MKNKSIFIFIVALFISNQILPMQQQDREIETLAFKLSNSIPLDRALDNYNSNALKSLKEHLLNNSCSSSYGQKLSISNNSINAVDFAIEINKDIIANDLDNKQDDHTQKFETTDYCFKTKYNRRVLKVKNNKTEEMFNLDLYPEYAHCIHFKDTDFICLYGDNSEKVMIIDLENKHEFIFNIQTRANIVSINPRISKDKKFLVLKIKDDEEEKENIEVFDLESVINIENIITNQEHNKEQRLFSEKIECLLSERNKTLKRLYPEDN